MHVYMNKDMHKVMQRIKRRGGGILDLISGGVSLNFDLIFFYDRYSILFFCTSLQKFS